MDPQATSLVACPFCAEGIHSSAKRCWHCHSDLDPPNVVRKSLKRVRRSVIASIIGAIFLTSWLVPLISDRLNRDRTLYEARLRLANQVVTSGTEVEAMLNDIEAIYSIFMDDARKMPVAAMKGDQGALRARLVDHYLVFQHKGWWWYREIQRDADFPKKLPKDARNHLNKICDDYQAALLEETNALRSLWDACIREPVTPANVGGYDGLFKATKRKLDDSGTKRRKCLQEMAHFFDEVPPKHWWSL